jgi:hypothetical protein
MSGVGHCIEDRAEARLRVMHRIDEAGFEADKIGASGPLRTGEPGHSPRIIV